MRTLSLSVCFLLASIAYVAAVDPLRVANGGARTRRGDVGYLLMLSYWGIHAPWNSGMIYLGISNTIASDEATSEYALLPVVLAWSCVCVVIYLFVRHLAVVAFGDGRHVVPWLFGVIVISDAFTALIFLDVSFGGGVFWCDA